MTEKKFKLICKDIGSISPFIRFVGVIGERELLAYIRRPDLTPLLDEKNTQYQFSHIAMNSDLEGFFDKNLGRSRICLGRKEESTNNIICNKESKSLGLNR